MSIHRNKYLAFSLAGAFFALVCLTFASVVIVGMLRMSRPTHNSYRTYQPPPPTPEKYDATAPMLAAAPEGKGGRLVAQVDGREVELPTLKTDYQVDVRGDLVAVQLTQRFENPGKVPLNASYQFPLHEDAAVHAMTMRVGDQVYRAVIQEEAEARATFEKAVAEGKSAALTEQHRPNFFEQSVGNLMPGVPVEVELRYVHAAERRDGRYHLALPLVVGPRFVPDDMSGNELVDGSGELEALPPQQAPTSIDEERVSIAVRIDAGMPIVAVESASHAVDVQRLGTTDARVGLKAGRTIDNRDFSLSYVLAGEDTQAGLLADYDPRAKHGYFSLLVEPPAGARHDLATPREMVFVLDCSGSMAGQPMDASKAFMRRALTTLRPTDSFRIIRFSDSATDYSSEPILATVGNVEDALAYVDELEGSGGTVMTSGIEQALTVPPKPGTIRLVTFMTDGYIGNDFEVVTLLRRHIGDARLFAIGVGTSVNRYLIEEMGRTGRGFSRYIDPTANIDQVASELAERLETPLLTDISIDAPTAGIDQLSPQLVPDLFAGQSLRVVGTYRNPGRHTFEVHGKVAGRAVTIPVTVNLPAQSEAGDAVRLTWARAQIADRMHDLTAPASLRPDGPTDPELQRQITDLGLQHSLMTQWTSFVATSDEPINPNPAANAEADVPRPQVAGTRFESFGGSSTPEPGIISGLLVTLVAAGSARRRRRRED